MISIKVLANPSPLSPNKQYNKFPLILFDYKNKRVLFPEQFIFFLIELFNNSSNQKININQKVTNPSQNYNMEIKSKISPMIIGYWPIRLKAQVSRLVCQYLHLSYQDKFFDPLSWNHYKENEAKTWIFKDLPFLKDENFIVTGSLAMVTYICEKAEKRELFGKNLQDKVKIDNLCQKCDILMLAHATNWCSQKHGQIQRKQCLQSHWSKKIKPLLMIYEEECQLDSWFFSYPTVIDFIVYQIVNQIEAIYPKQIICFDKLRKLRQKVGKITQIEAYEKSQRAVKQCCPTYYFKSFKEQKINSLTQSSQTASQRSKGQ